MTTGKAIQVMAEESASSKLWIIDAVKNLGLPTVFLGILLYMLWCAGSWAAHEVVLPLFKKQIEFIDRVASMSEQVVDTTRQVEMTLKEHGVNVAKVKDQNDQNTLLINGSAKEHSELLKRIVENTDVSLKKNEEQAILLKKIEENTNQKTHPGQSQ